MGLCQEPTGGSFHWGRHRRCRSPHFPPATSEVPVAGSSVRGSLPFQH